MTQPHSTSYSRSAQALSRLGETLESFDEAEAVAVIEEVHRELGTDGLVVDLLMPFLHAVGKQWSDGSLSVAQEHFASNVVRGRLASLTGPVASLGGGAGPVTVVACPPGERHDIAPLAFAVLLGQRGWRVRFLGADTPLADLAFACRRLDPDLVVVAATRQSSFGRVGARLRKLSATHPVSIAGAGSSASLARELSTGWLRGDVGTGARQADALVHPIPL